MHIAVNHNRIHINSLRLGLLLGSLHTPRHSDYSRPARGPDRTTALYEPDHIQHQSTGLTNSTMLLLT